MKRYVVCFIFDQKMQNVLMLLRNKEPYKNKLNGLGGKIEEGESKETSLFREIYEESGYHFYDFVKFHHLTTMVFPSNIELNAFYLILDKDKENLIKNDTEKQEGTLKWINIESSNILNASDNKFAGEGNIAYFINYALKIEGNHT